MFVFQGYGQGNGGASYGAPGYSSYGQTGMINYILLKDTIVNAIRSHAQSRPRLYFSLNLIEHALFTLTMSGFSRF